MKASIYKIISYINGKCLGRFALVRGNKPVTTMSLLFSAIDYVSEPAAMKTVGRKSRERKT